MNAIEQKTIMRRLKLSNGKPVLINGLFYWVENENISCSFPSAKAIRNAEKIGTVLDNEYSFFEPMETSKEATNQEKTEKTNEESGGKETEITAIITEKKRPPHLFNPIVTGKHMAVSQSRYEGR